MQLDTSALRAEATPTGLDRFDPRGRVLCALVLAFVLASVRSFSALLCGVPVVLVLFFLGEPGPLARELLHLNAVGAFIALLLMLTYPFTVIIAIIIPSSDKILRSRSTTSPTSPIPKPSTITAPAVTV